MVPERTRSLRLWALAVTLAVSCALILGPLATSALAVRWIRQTSSTMEHLADMSFFGIHFGWACGNNGIIMHTENDGVRWTRQRSNTTMPLTSICFVDSKNGWSAGQDGTMLHTIDSGVTWQRQAPGTDDDFRSVKFRDRKTGLAAGGGAAGGFVIYTTDSGAHWYRGTIASTGTINSVTFSSTTTAWAVGEASSIFKSINGGQTWQAQYPAPTTLNTIFFIDSTRGWAGGKDGTILVTKDGGDTWQRQDSNTVGMILRMRFVDPNNGWATTLGPGIYTGSVIRTGNGGASWTKVFDTHQAMPGIAFYNYDYGWIAGWNGTIIQYRDLERDRSTRWVRRVSGTSATISGVDFTDAAFGWAVTNHGGIYQSQNGGITWRAQTSGTTTGLLDVRFQGRRHGWAVGHDGIVVHSDDGTHWTAQTYGGTSRHALCLSGTGNLWAAGQSSTGTPPGGNITRTTDGGASWAAVDAPVANDLTGVTFTSADSGWLVGNGGVLLHTSDGTVATPHWDLTRPIGGALSLSSVTFLSSSIGVVVGQDGMILRTTDGGVSWTRPNVPTGKFLDAVASRAPDVWAVGEGGVILHSSDSGATWRRQLSYTNQWLTSVRALSKDLLWASGTNGVILTGALPVSLTRPTVPRTVVHQSAFIVRSYLSPRHAAGISSAHFEFYHLEHGRWPLRKTVNARNSNSGNRTLCWARVTLRSSGKWRVRAHHPSDRHPGTLGPLLLFTVR